jgi:hypothetical protein
MLMLSLAVPMVACAPLGMLGAPADATQATGSWLESQKTVITQRAEARWKALIAGDFQSAYEFETPARRSVFSLQQYKGNFGNSVVWRLATVKSVEYDPANVARVVLDVEYQAPVKGVENARGVRQMTEKWLYSDGGWWYISQ